MLNKYWILIIEYILNTHLLKNTGYWKLNKMRTTGVWWASRWVSGISIFWTWKVPWRCWPLHPSRTIDIGPEKISVWRHLWYSETLGKLRSPCELFRLFACLPALWHTDWTWLRWQDSQRRTRQTPGAAWAWNRRQQSSPVSGWLVSNVPWMVPNVPWMVLNVPWRVPNVPGRVPNVHDKECFAAQP